MTTAVAMLVEGLPNIGDGGGDINPRGAVPDGEEETAVCEGVLFVDAADDAVAPLYHDGVGVMFVGGFPHQAKAVANFDIRLTVLVKAAHEGGRMTKVDCHHRPGE